MKKYKRLAYLFGALAILLSNIMCAAVAYNYCAMQWGGWYKAWSAPANVAFLLCIPYGIGMIICVVLACFFNKKRHSSL